MQKDSITGSRIGAEHLVEFKQDFHHNLSKYWPEPREQLHIGGWTTTYEMVNRLHMPDSHHVLDLCCGEGSTACWLAHNYPVRVTGIDIVERAIRTAQANCKSHTLPAGTAHFVVGNIFHLPFVGATFDVIYGQDPDGLAHHQRGYAFTECLRVLKPGGQLGFQHWILHDDAPPTVVRKYEEINHDLGYSSMGRLRVSDYVDDMQQAGFHDIVVEDMSTPYRKHMEAIAQNAHDHGSATPDPWTKLVLDIFERGYKIGVFITGSKTG